MLKEQDGNKIRLSVRREKILKICSSHHIREGMKLSLMLNLKKAKILEAIDINEGALQCKTFAVKVKQDAHVKEFKELFEHAKQIASSSKVEQVDRFERTNVQG